MSATIIGSMAWEWVAPVATGTVGVFGTFIAWLTGKQGRDHAETITRDQLDQTRVMQREANRHDEDKQFRAEAYKEFNIMGAS